MRKRSILVLFLGVLICLSLVLQGLFAGHYEGTTSSEMTKYINMQTVPAEYSPVSYVVLNYELISGYQKESLVKAVLDSGVKKVLMLTDKNSKLDINGPEFSKLRSMIGSNISRVQLIPSLQSGFTTVWSRDWAPLGAISKSDGKLRLVDINYYPERPSDDSAPSALSAALNIERISAPVYNEGGNFMVTNTGRAFTTKEVVNKNSSIHTNGDLVLGENEIAKYYKEYAGCKELTVFEKMPYEGTGHIDMWSKLLNDNTVMIAEIREASLTNYINKSNPDKSYIDKVRSIQKYMNERAVDFAEKGFKVIRIPAILPFNEYGGFVFSSYTNSLIANGTAIVPKYIKLPYSGDYYDKEFLGDYEKEVQAAYESQGYRVIWVDSDNLSSRGGAVHCSTMQLP